MEADRGSRGGFDVWADFAKGHPDLEDMYLSTMAEAERDGSLAAATTPRPQPAEAEDEDAWIDPDDLPHINHDLTEGMTADEVEEQAVRLTRVYPRLIGFNGQVSIIAFGVNNHLRDLWIDAWDHYIDHDCEEAAECMDRLLEQLIGAFHMARGMTSGDD